MEEISNNKELLLIRKSVQLIESHASFMIFYSFSYIVLFDLLKVGILNVVTLL